MDLMLRRRMLMAMAVVRKILHTIASATGLVSFTTQLAEPLESCVCEVAPVQSGTGDPSPTNVRPITGWTGITVYRGGKNLLDRTNAVTGKRLDNVGGLTGKSGAETSDYIPVKPGQRYAARGVIQNGSGYAVWLYDGNKTKISYIAGGSGSGYGGSCYFNAPSNACYVRVTYAENSASAMLMAWPAGSSSGVWDVPFESAPPISAVPVNWTSEAGTVYGGTLNVVTGVLTVDRASYDLYADRASFLQGNGNVYISSGVWYPHGFVYPINTAKTISSHFKALSATSKTVPSFSVSNTGTFAVNGATGITDTPANLVAYLEAQQQAGTPVQFIFPLRTPQTIQLTPEQISSIIGSNTVWHDGNGAITVDYYDTQ